MDGKALALTFRVALSALEEKVRLSRPGCFAGELLGSWSGALCGCSCAAEPKALPPVSKPSVRICKPACCTKLPEPPFRRSFGRRSAPSAWVPSDP